jgi:hypothetical protein
LKREAPRFKSRKISAAITPDVKRFSHQIKRTRFSAHTAATIEPDEQSAVGPTQVRPAWRALLEDIELMSQDQDFGFQPSTRLETVAQHTDEEEGDCDHQPQSCSDSAAAVTPADGVFGSDTSKMHSGRA